MNIFSTTISMSILIAALAQGASRESLDKSGDTEFISASDSTTSTTKLNGAKSTNGKEKNYQAVEKDLNRTQVEEAGSGEEAVIETSHPYLLPRLFTLPTAYSLKSYEVRFGGQGNIQSTLANMNTENLKISLSVGLGGIMELGYQLDEYYTVQNISDKILMGYFKLSLLKESKFIPALSISASKNLRNNFHVSDTFSYAMDEDQYDVVMSKTLQMGDNLISIHPGAQIIRDKVSDVAGRSVLGNNYQLTKVNPRLGLSWQSHPKTLFMYEFKLLHPTNVNTLKTTGMTTELAMENNLGVRYYIRNWLCIDSGIRHYYNMDQKQDEMKLHANFVGVIPMETVYNRVQNYFKK